jgi:ribosomal protein L37E
MDRWAALESQGKGVNTFRGNPVSNCWLKQDILFPGEEIDLLKMRANLFPTKETLNWVNRSRERQDILCRRCNKDSIETLGHVLGDCPYSKELRIARHNAVVDRIQARTTELGYTVAREQIFEADTGPLRPDLVIKSQGGAWVVDVTVRFEQGESLTNASREKRAKYQAIIPAVKQDMGMAQVDVMAVVLPSAYSKPPDQADIQNCLHKLCAGWLAGWLACWLSPPHK